MRKIIRKESGLSLVEVVAATLILTLLLTSFLTLLLSGAKSTQQAKEIVDYTFIAQSNMETIFEHSRNTNLSSLNPMMTDILSYQLISSNSDSSTYEKTDMDQNNNSYEIKVTFNKYVSTQSEFQSLSSTLNRVIIEVIPQNKSNPAAKVESLLEWAANE